VVKFWRSLLRIGFLEPLRAAFLLLLAAISLVAPFKILLLREARIGEFGPRTDFFLRRVQAGAEPNIKGFRLAIVGSPSNGQLLRMFKRHLHIFQNRFLNFIINSQKIERSRFFYWLPLPVPETEDAEFCTAQPVLHFNQWEEERGQELLAAMGIPEGAWFVAFHARDSGYTKNMFPGQEKHPSDYRNCSIGNYYESMQYVTSLGGYAIRVGSDIMEDLPDHDNPRIIDYARDYRSDFGDIYVLAKCKYFVGCSSGITSIPGLFNVPVVDANSAPWPMLPPGERVMRFFLGDGDMFLPRPFWSLEEDRLLTFRETLQNGLANFSSLKQFDQTGVKVMENESRDILEVTKEMNQRIDGCFAPGADDEKLQARFRTLVDPSTAGKTRTVRVGAKFLETHSNLLD